MNHQPKTSGEGSLTAGAGGGGGVAGASDANERVLAALQALPPQDNQACREALKAVPELVEREAYPQWFLEVEDNDAARAAVRMAGYWSERKQLFGERAHLPMNLSGSGALNKVDVEVAQLGHIMRRDDDAEGRPVLCNSPVRLAPLAARAGLTPPELKATMRRNLFYLLNAAAIENRNAQTKGLVVLRCLPSNFRFDFNGGHAQFLRRLVTQVLPFRPHAIHVCVIPDQKERNQMLQTAVAAFAQFWNKSGQISVFVHVETCVEDLLGKLTKFGISNRSLPPLLEGSWSPQMPLATFADTADTAEEVQVTQDRERGLNDMAASHSPKSAASADSTESSQEASALASNQRLNRDPTIDVLESLTRQQKRLRSLSNNVNWSITRADDGVLGTRAATALSLLDSFAAESSVSLDETPGYSADEALGDSCTLEIFASCLEETEPTRDEHVIEEEEDLQRLLESLLAERASLLASSAVLNNEMNFS